MSTTPVAAAATADSTSAPGVKTDRARRHQRHLDDVPAPASSASVQEHHHQQQSTSTGSQGFIEWRGGPQTLAELQLRVVSKDEHFLVLNKGADERLDGDFEVTIEKALARDFPDVPKFRWIHQLDFATSGLLCVGVARDATSLACRLFREKRVQKEYLAVVRGHLPFDPADHFAARAAAASSSSPAPTAAAASGSLEKPVTQCTLSKLGWLIRDTEEFERLKTQQKGSQAHQRDPKYPRGVHHGPSLFHMAKAKLMRERAAEGKALTADEQVYVARKWRDLSRDEQEPFKQQGLADKARFVEELTQFLDTERLRLARKRKYDVMEPSEGEQNSDDDASASAPQRPRRAEPVAYVFDDRIAEPSSDGFRMQIGDATTPGKASSTIAFVLGHGSLTINGKQERVTKVLLRPLTGRRHQLRLHLAHNGFPIVGDVTYGDDADDAQRMMLHAWKLWLMAPPDAQTQYGDLFFTSPDPFDALVPTEREISTLTYLRDKKRQEERAQADAAAAAAPATATH